MINIIVFVFMTIFIYCYSYALGGDNTIMMLYMLLLSPVVSFVLTIPARRRLGISIETPSSEVEKDGKAKVNVCIKNNTLFPAPFIDIIFLQAVNFDTDGQDTIRLFLGPFQTKTVTMEYTAKCRGVAEIGVKSILLRDYLGFFRFNILKHMEDCRTTGEVTVLPRLFNIKSNSKVLMDSGQAYIPDDEGTQSAGVFSWTGEPGHEFREYAPGDPLHKVHWKLSAKKEVLMVRKDEGRGIPKKCLILDPAMGRKQISKEGLRLGFLKRQENGQAGPETLIVEEKVLESLLSVANVFAKSGRDVEVWMLESGLWTQFLIKELKNVKELQYKIAEYQFERASNFDVSTRMPLSGILEKKGNGRNSGGGEIIVFTGSPDKTLLESINCFFNYRMAVDVVMIKDTAENSKSPDKSDVEFPAPEYGKLWVLAVDEDLTEALS